MTPEDYRTAGVLFDRLRAVPEDQRAAILDVSCAGNPELRRQVLLLLDSDRELAGGSFLERRALDDAARLLSVDGPGLPAAGALIGNYRLGARIQAGGMGVVYEATDLRLERRVALKILPTSFAGEGPERVQRFQQEARAISLLNHPNIVSIFDAGCEGQLCHIVTEFIEGTTLRERLASSPIGFPEALDIAIQCATALEAAHAAGVLHRDIKPENIMLRPDGVVKIVDFGLARVAKAAREGGPLRTQTGVTMGTPRYMSPEQARGEAADPRADIFSLGAVLYEMTAGRPAFPGETTAEVFAALLTTDAAPPTTWNRELPADLDPVVAKALVKDPGGRYASMTEFASALRALRQRLETRRQVEQLRESQKPVRRAIAVGALFAVAAAGLAAWRFWPLATAGPVETLAYTSPLTSFTGYKNYPALSPDGRMLAFSWNGGQGGHGGKQERNIYVMPVGGDSPTRLTDSLVDNLWPAWSPDGKWIAFARRVREPRADVYIVPVAGDPGSRISAAGPERKVATGGNGVGWSADGLKLAFARLPHPVGSGAIAVVSVGNGEEQEITNPGPDYDNFPAFSPDGKWLAFTRGRSEERREIWIQAAGGGPAKQLTFEEKHLLGFTWTPDSAGMIVSMQREGYGVRLWRVPAAGGPLKPLAVPTEDASQPQTARRSPRLAYTESLLDTNIYRSAGPGIGVGRFGLSRPLILSSREDHSPSFSSDGQWIAFVSTRSGSTEVWIARQDGTSTRQVTSFRGATVGTPRWSPDGRWIAFDCVTNANSDIFVVDPADGVPKRLTSDPDADIMPSWSTDGKWIVFTSGRSGTQQLWRIPANGGPEVQLTKGGAREAWPSPDGQRIYFTRRRPEAEIWTVPVGGGPEEPVPELAEYNRISRAWGVVRDGIYFISREDKERQDVRFFHFGSRRVSVLHTLEHEPVWAVPALALSPDGRQLLSVHLDHEVNDFMLIDNFR